MMRFPRDNTSLQGLSAAVFAASLLILFAPLFVPAVAAHYTACAAAAAFNVAVLWAWFSFGNGGGMALAGAGLLIVFFASRKTPSCPSCVISLAVSGAAGYLLHRKYMAGERSYTIAMEKAEEAMNLVVEKIRRRREDIDTFRDRITRYAALKEVVETLSTTLSISEIERLVIDSVLRIVGKADRALLFLVDHERQELSLSASWVRGGAAKVKDKKGDTFDRWILKQRKPLLIEDPERDFRFSQDILGEAKRRFRSLIGAPLVVGNAVLGTLRLDSEEGFSYDQEDLRLIDIIADFAAVAVENNRLYRKTGELAIKDSLTDLVVSRYFRERLAEETTRAALSKSVFSLLMLDIDFFKNYNDRYGHIAGDIVLRYLAGMLKKAAKAGDVVARYGGEEFALILLGRDKKAALGEAEAIRRKIEAEPLILRREKTSLTVSVGVAAFPADAPVAEELLKKADRSLYKAKEGGRNRVVG